MSEELDFELVEDNDDGQSDTTNEDNESITDSEESKEGDEEDTTASTKGKKSNWKKISKINKGLKAENAELRKKLEALKANKTEEDDFDDEEDNDTWFDATEFRFFLIENPEAKDYRSQIESTLNDYPNLSFEDALALVKAKTPKESTSSKDFSTKWSNVKVRKRLADLTDEEALKLDNKKYLEYQRIKWKIR